MNARNLQSVIDAVDTAFTPDIRVTLDERDNVTTAEGLTNIGKEFMDGRPIIGMWYDTLLCSAVGLTIESTEG